MATLLLESVKRMFLVTLIFFVVSDNFIGFYNCTSQPQIPNLGDYFLSTLHLGVTRISKSLLIWCSIPLVWYSQYKKLKATTAIHRSMKNSLPPLQRAAALVECFSRMSVGGRRIMRKWLIQFFFIGWWENDKLQTGTVIYGRDRSSWK